MHNSRATFGRLFLTAALGCGPLVASPGHADVADFALLDHSGAFHQLSYYDDQQAVVLLVQRNDHPAVARALPAFQGLQQAYADSSVRFFMLNPMATDDRAAIAGQARERGYTAPVLLDDAMLVAEALEITRVGEVLVIDPGTMQLAYRGTLDDDGAVRRVLDTLTAGQAWTDPLPALAEAPAAERIAYPSRQRHAARPVSYTGDIVPILERQCVGCHHEGGIGPWAMTSHRMVQGFAPMIKEVVTTRRMPPGQIDQHVSKAVHDPAGLTVAERQALVHWIDAGAPADGDVDPLTLLEFTPRKFTMGEPDLVYTVPAQQIPATGLIDYRYVPVKLDLDRDVWIRGMEFVPGDRQVLHHVIAYVQAPADRSREGRRDEVARGESVGGFAPGRPGEDFGEHGGRLLPKGANLLLQMHYTTAGRATVDETQIGIYLHEARPRYVMSEVVAGQRRFLVPPHAKEHELQGEQLFERDAWLYALMPHMHYRGKRMRYTAVYPDGSEEVLLSVPRYDFNWQFNYQLKEPVFLPAGTRLVADGAMDNSAQNRGNPDPSQPVHFGLQTRHEMFFGFSTVRYVEEMPEG